MEINSYFAEIVNFLDKDGLTLKRLTLLENILFTKEADYTTQIEDGQKIAVNSVVSYKPKDMLLFDDVEELIKDNPEAKYLIYDFIRINERTHNNTDNSEISYTFLTFRYEREKDNFQKVREAEKEKLDDPINLEHESALRPILDVLKNFETNRIQFIESLKKRKLPPDKFNSLAGTVSELSQLTANIFKPESITGKETINTTLLPILQDNFSALTSLTYPMNKVARKPFLQEYSKAQLQSKSIILNFSVGGKSDPDIITKLNLAINEDLDYMDYLTLSAWYTAKKENPDFNGITFLDLANSIHKSLSGEPLKSRDKFVNEVKSSALKLMRLYAELDFSQEAEHYKSKNKSFKDYLNNGGDCKIMFNYISAIKMPIKKANGRVLDGLAPNGSKMDNLFFEYIDRVGQIKTLSGDCLKNPLRATRDNASIFHYMLYRLANMPYSQSTSKRSRPKINLLNAKLDYQKKAQELGKRGAKSLPSTQEAIKLQKSLKNHERTINIDKLITELKLQRVKRSRIINKMELVLESWKKCGYIDNYKPNYKGRSIMSFTINFF